MNNDRSPEQRVYSDAQALAAWLIPLRAAGKKLVTTNGCFDIIHSGHVRYLAEAAEKGDLLRLKGEGRPLRPEGDRVLTVAALAMVDAAFIFREDDPRAFLETLMPDLHVKGGDYTENIIERETVERHGGKVAIVSYVRGFSTTSIMKKMQPEKK
jgi:rfaE bifunctional protein nucleotidyltransferase chain/domain